MGFNFGFRPKTQFGPDSAQINVHFALTDAHHMLGELSQRVTRAQGVATM
jgi:hypothetical protein